jgi:phosphoribosylaminoimidazole carboxylase
MDSKEAENTRVSENGLPRCAVLGVLGGGQLGQMMALACANLGIRVKTLDASDDACARICSEHVKGHFRDPQAVASFADSVDVLTVEIEHVDTNSLRALEVKGKDIQPTSKTLSTIQDKFIQKQHFQAAGVPVGPFKELLTETDVATVAQEFGFPLMLKSRKLAYDGKGNFVVNDESSLSTGISQLGGLGQGLYAEKWQYFVKELAVMVVRNRDGSVLPYPLVETVHRDNICHVTETPADVSPEISVAASQVASKAIAALDGAGIFGVEMFLLNDMKTVLLNEVAPRPHNSGHYTMDGCLTSQFENHVRAVFGWPLGEVSLTSPYVIMLNILGDAEGQDGMRLAHEMMARAYRTPGCKVHWYGKAETSEKVKKGRKLGHINIVGQTRAEVRSRLNAVDPSGFIALQKTAASYSGLSISSPVVGIIMGSDSDFEKMSAAAQILDQFGIPVEVTIVSAHRTPERMMQYARTAHSRGLKLIIAGAGGAAHLPGMVAAMTPLPVIGVPVMPKGYHLDGIDALLSIVQMPKGVPVATVAIDNATNAGLLAVRILGSGDPVLLEKMRDYQQMMTETVLTKAERLEKGGWKDFRVA